MNEEALVEQQEKDKPSRETVSQNNHKFPWTGSHQSWTSCSAAWQPSVARERRASARLGSAWCVPVRRRRCSRMSKLYARINRLERTALEFKRLNWTFFLCLYFKILFWGFLWLFFFFPWSVLGEDQQSSGWCCAERRCCNEQAAHTLLYINHPWTHLQTCSALSL